GRGGFGVGVFPVRGGDPAVDPAGCEGLRPEVEGTERKGEGARASGLDRGDRRHGGRGRRTRDRAVDLAPEMQAWRLDSRGTLGLEGNRDVEGQVAVRQAD